MNNKLLLIIIVLIIVFGVFIFLGNKKTNPTTSNQPEPTISQQTTPAAMETNGKVTNVILGDSGFVPKDITVKAGTRIIWTNSSGTAATVSSNDHPTHRLYPFLNLGEFANGSSVQIVAGKAGKYIYHNHLNASETGTVTVE